MRRNILLVFLGVLISAPLLPVTIIVDPNPKIIAESITDEITGADLAGLIVTETYDGPATPFTVKAVWKPTGPRSGAASVIYGLEKASTIAVNGSASASMAWQYSGIFLSPLNSVLLDGTAAGIYFGRAHSTPSTPGSGSGADISIRCIFPTSCGNGVVATYSDAVSLKGDPPRNDLYAKLLIEFFPPYGGLPPGDFMFTQPVDRNVTPEPASSLLVLSGLAVSLCLGWRKMRSRRANPRIA